MFVIVTLGQFYRSSDNFIVLPGDIVKLIKAELKNSFSRKRIIFIKRNFRFITNIKSKIILTLQPVLLFIELLHYISYIKHLNRKFFLI